MFYVLLGELVFKKLSNGKYIMIANRYGEIEKGFFTDEDLNYLKLEGLYRYIIPLFFL